MSIPSVRLLTRIAELWSRERQGTLQQRDSAEILTDLLDALRKGEFILAGGNGATERAQDELQILLWEWDKLTVIKKNLKRAFVIGSWRLGREEFLRWVDHKGYPRPKFWDEKPDEAPQPKAANRPTTLRTFQKDERRRASPQRDRVLAAMRADVDAGEVTIEQLRRNKKHWAKVYCTKETTARDAAIELERVLKSTD
jgi:hypothetical protein